jgi:hypothetical protein
MARKIKIRQKTRKFKTRKSRTYKGGSNNETRSTTQSQNEYRTRMVQRALENARQKEQQESYHSRNRPGPGTLSAGNAARYREYNKAIKGNSRRE